MNVDLVLGFLAVAALLLWGVRAGFRCAQAEHRIQALIAVDERETLVLGEADMAIAGDDWVVGDLEDVR